MQNFQNYYTFSSQYDIIPQNLDKERVGNMFDNLLNYWYSQEFFSPCWPVKLKEDCDLTKCELPWITNHTNPKIRLSYEVYFGKILVGSAINYLLDKLALKSEDDVIEKDTSLTCLFAIKVDANGKYVADSFAISSFVWAIYKLVSAKSISHELSYQDINKLQQEINDVLLEHEQENEAFIISHEYLHRLFSYVCNKLLIPDGQYPYAAWSRCKKDYANKMGEFSPINPTTELMQSFYLKDIKLVQNDPTQRVQHYVTSMQTSSSQKERIHIDCDILQMQKCLSADSFPLGAWPSNYSPSLMQQIGINLAISGEHSIFSINGPPGTGKTTLLKEIVASNIIQRAILLSEYDAPDKAFRKKSFTNPINEYNKTYYRMDSKISAFGMIVASNNNAAVENISTELPKLIKADRTGHFSRVNESSNDDTYFSDVATKLLGEPAWGLISARLGKKDNLSKLKERLWWAEDGVTLGHYYNLPAPNWTLACKNFRFALDAVRRAQLQIKDAQNALLDLQESEKLLKSSQLAESQARESHKQNCNLLKIETEQLLHLENNLSSEEANALRLKARIPFFKRILFGWFKDDPIIKEWKSTTKRIEQLEIEIIHQTRTCAAAQEAKNDAEEALTISNKNTKCVEEKFVSAESKVESLRSHFKGNWADCEFWHDILHNEASQSACPWTTPQYNTLREELFYQALMLHKSFILSSNAVKQNINRLFNVWDGKITGIDKSASYGHLLNTLLLVIPVVSTTFASVQSFLDGIGAEELGLLIVDEAGQATPQSVLGAMWRTRKAIIVGDPLQVEPIVKIPKELRRHFAEKYNIPSNYRLPEISVQMLADSANKFGGTRTVEGNRLWLGCPLVTHRRCLNPMFGISNEIAYNNRMFIKTPPPEPDTPFLLPKSIWFDCRGPEKGNKNHTVPEQIVLAGKLFEKAIDIYADLPDIYLITPFTTVERSLSVEIRKIVARKYPSLENAEIDKWVDKHCGTVHTFQGKEANEVIFVLGCDAKTGRGAAQWVGQRPNIVNVAVSRAKYRLGVIGDSSLWKDIPYVQNIYRCLDQETDFSLFLANDM